MAPPAVVVTYVVLRLVFYAYIAVGIIRHVLRDRTVTMDAIAGAACAYMLLGMVWMHLYLLIELAHPGSFDIPAGFLVRGDPTIALGYFSFVTLTTLGYGDIHPSTAAAAGFCAVEALVGQLYLAITIARMVGLELAGRSG